MPPHRRGFYQGIYGSSFALAALVGPALGGLIYGRLGGAALWVGCLFAGLVFAQLTLLLQPMYERLQGARAQAKQI